MATFEYDALGRRIEKVDAIAGTTTRYYYDDQRVAVRTQVSGGVESDDRYFVFGNYIDEVLLMRTAAGTDLYYAHDHLYSPVALFAANGTVAERYEYDAYGSIQILNSAFSILNSSQYANPYTFTGRERDTLDAGSLTLMYYRTRTYDPQTGRFMQRDPLGIDPAGRMENPFDSEGAYEDGLNIYQYVQANPVNYVDPYGLKCKFKEHYIYTPTKKPPFLKKELYKLSSDDHFNCPPACQECCDTIYARWKKEVSFWKALLAGRKTQEACHTLCIAKKKPFMLL